MQAMTGASADPPLMKNAGRLDVAQAESLGFVIVALVFGLVASGALVQAVMTNHGRSGRGFALNALAGVAALGVFVVMGAAIGGHLGWRDLLNIGLPFAGLWLVLALLAFAVGAVIQPPGKARRRG